MKEAKKLKKIINNYKSFLITGHERPDGDTLGSSLVLTAFLKNKNKNVEVVMDEIPKNLKLLPKTNLVKTKPTLKEYDVAILLECSDKSRVPTFVSSIKFKKIINIDHHQNLPKVGDINIIYPEASACAEIIYKILKSLNEKITNEQALLLYTGILTDTGKFQWNNTTPEVLKIASELLKYKISPLQIYKRIYAQKEIKEVKTIGKIIQKLKTIYNGKVAYVEVNNQSIATDDLLDAFGLIKGTELFVVFRNLKKNQTRINIRSFGKIDVNKIAMDFNGGGHVSAAGCLLPYNLKKSKEIFLKRLKKSLKQI